MFFKREIKKYVVYYNWVRKIEKTKTFIPLNFDLLFKKVFGDPKDLIPIKYLLKQILNITPRKITILNSEIIGRPYKDKRVYVDLVVELEDGTKVGVEVNTDVEQKIIDRNFYLMCKNMSKDLKPNEDYRNLKKHIQINFDLEGKHQKPIMKYFLMEEEVQEKLTDLITIIRIDVPYFTKICYNNDTKDLNELTKFIGLFGAEDLSFCKTLCKGDDKMEDIGKRIEEYNDDADVIGAYDYEWHQKQLNEIRVERAEKEAREKGHTEGHAEGLAEGINQRNIEIAKNLLKKKIDIDIISEATNLSVEEIENLYNN